MDWDKLVALLVFIHRPDLIPDPPPPDVMNRVAAEAIRGLAGSLQNERLGREIGELAGAALRA